MHFVGFQAHWLQGMFGIVMVKQKGAQTNIIFVSKEITRKYKNGSGFQMNSPHGSVCQDHERANASAVQGDLSASMDEWRIECNPL